MSLIIPNRKLVQPIIGPSPIAGCRALFDLRWGIDVVNGIFPAASTVGSPVARPGGMSYNMASAKYLQFAHHDRYSITGPITILALLDVNSVSAYGHIIAKQASTASSGFPYELRLGVGTSDTRLVFLRGSTLSNRQHQLASSRFTPPKNNVFVGARSTGSTIETVPDLIYENTITAGTAGSAGTGAVADDAIRTLWIGRRFDSATNLDGHPYWIALFDRALDDDEILRIWADPSILFPQQPRRNHVGVAAAAATFSPAWAYATNQTIIGGQIAA